jgi:hypothetical protein
MLLSARMEHGLHMPKCVIELRLERDGVLTTAYNGITAFEDLPTFSRKDVSEAASVPVFRRGEGDACSVGPLVKSRNHSRDPVIEVSS